MNVIDVYKFNIFYKNEELGDDFKKTVVQFVNKLPDQKKTDFVSIFTYLGIDQHYFEYKKLIYLGLGVNIKNEWGFTALHFAYMYNDEEFVAYLLRYGADPDAKITNGPLCGKVPIELRHKSEL
jgi:ankyrin repeat protein